MKRRSFFKRSGVALAALPILGTSAITAGPPHFDTTDWRSVRDQFALTRSHIYMATFLLASHPRPVADAIERHRRAFDTDPVAHWEENFRSAEPAIQTAAATYLNADPAHIALTDSTTMGLGLVYARFDSGLTMKSLRRMLRS